MTDNKINIEKVRPEYIAQRCPVCNGFGTVKHGLKTCGACEGRCYVMVPLNGSVPPFPKYKNTMYNSNSDDIIER